jgi:GT2 family glycosyltransferase
MENRPCVTAVIVTYQSSSEIVGCLKSLEDHAAGWITECRIVDNHSADGTADIAARDFPSAVVIRNRENLGYSKGVNIGAKQLATEYLLVLNPDTALKEKALSEMIRFMDHRGEAAACGPKLVGPDGAFQASCRRGFPTPYNTIGYYFGLDRLFPKSKKLSSYKRRAVAPDREAIAEVLSGACMLLRSDDFRSVNGFDEDYFLFGEDIDICWKLHHSGKELWYVPAAEVVHMKGSSMKQSRKRSRHEFYRSMLIYIDKRLSCEYSRFACLLMKAGVRCRWLLAYIPGC